MTVFFLDMSGDGLLEWRRKLSFFVLGRGEESYQISYGF